MDQKEAELDAVFSAAEAMFNEKLPPLRASVSMGDMMMKRSQFRFISYGDYIDEEWGFYVQSKTGLVRICDGTRRQKIQAASVLKALWHMVIRHAEQEIKEIEKASALVLEFIKAIEGQ